MGTRPGTGARAAASGPHPPIPTHTCRRCQPDRAQRNSSSVSSAPAAPLYDKPAGLECRATAAATSSPPEGELSANTAALGQTAGATDAGTSFVDNTISTDQSQVAPVHNATERAGSLENSAEAKEGQATDEKLQSQQPSAALNGQDSSSGKAVEERAQSGDSTETAAGKCYAVYEHELARTIIYRV